LKGGSGAQFSVFGQIFRLKREFLRFPISGRGGIGWCGWDGRVQRRCEKGSVFAWCHKAVLRMGRYTCAGKAGV